MQWSIQHRCKNISLHIENGMYTGQPALSIPCPDCYSVVVYTKQIPYTNPVPWQTIEEDEG